MDSMTNLSVKHSLVRQAANLSDKKETSPSSAARQPAIMGTDEIKKKCFEGKTELRALAKNLDFLQNQLTVTQNRLSYAGRRLLHKASSGEVIENSQGGEFVLLLKSDVEESEKKVGTTKESVRTLREEIQERKQIESQKGELKQENERMTVEDMKLDALESDRNKLQAELDDLKVKEENIRVEKKMLLEEYKSKRDELENQVKLVEVEIAKVDQQNAMDRSGKLTNDICTSTNKLEETSARLHEVGEFWREKQVELTRTRDKHAELLRMLSGIREEVRENRTWYAKLQDREEQLYEEKDEVVRTKREEMADKRMRIRSLNEDIKRLESKIKIQNQNILKVATVAATRPGMGTRRATSYSLSAPLKEARNRSQSTRDLRRASNVK